MSESTKNLIKINELSGKLSNLENFLNYKWDKYSIPVIDVDFFDLFSRLVINHEVFEFGYELSKAEIEKLIDSGDITDRQELDKLKKILSRIDELDFEDYLSQNTLAIFKNPDFYISRLDETVLHTPLNNNDLDSNLISINLKCNKILHESGLANLYLTFGFYTSDDLNAPLIFIPVKLEQDGDKLKLSYNSHDEIRLNNSLELKLKENNILLPQKEIRSETDMISYLTEVNKLGEVKSIIALGLFDFSTALAFNDVDKFSKSGELNNLLKVSDETIKFNETEIDLIDENNSYNVFDADSSQISAIREALVSNNLFIDAPAGSKKVETIVNLISEIIANKKTVLYVSDKLDEIHKTEDKLFEIGLENAYIDLYGINYNYPQFIEEITKTAEINPKYDFDEHYTNSKLDELNDLKGKLAYYSNFISTPYKKTGLTPYHLMGLMENKYDEKLDEFLMKNLSDLTNDEYNEIVTDFADLSELYINKIHPTSKHAFNYIVAKGITDENIDCIITTIPNLKKELEGLIKLNDEINKKFGVKKLEKLNEYKSHYNKLDSIKNNPQIMGDDYEDLKEYVNALDIFQTKTKEYGTIEDLEKLLLVEVYNTQLDLEDQFKELNILNDNITKLNNLLDEFKSKISDAGIKNLNSIIEVEEVIGSLDLLDKNPTLISDEEKIDAFVEDLEKYQNECEINSPEDLLINIDNHAKSALTSTIEKINKLIEHKESIEDINTLIDDLTALKTEIGLIEFESMNNIDECLKKSDILLTNPVIVEDEKAIEEFIDRFETGANKFAEKDYDEYYSQMNEEINEIQNNITDEISQTGVLETNIPTIKKELNNILDNTKKLSQLLDIKEINSIKEIDEYSDNVEILLKNPIMIEDTDKNEINAYIGLLDSVQNDEEYTKLNLDDVNDLITKIIRFDKKVKKLNFEKQIFNNLDLRKFDRTISNCEFRLSASPINPKLEYSLLNKKFEIFTKEYNKLFKTFSGDYKKIKKELRSYYKYDAPKDDDIIYSNYKNHLEIIKELNAAKRSVLNYNKIYNSMETDQLRELLKQLINLQEEYETLENEYNALGIKSSFNHALDYLVPIKLILTDINQISNSTLKFKGIDSESNKINSKLKKYFPKTYFNLETNLNDLYEEYRVNEEYKKLVEEGFFSIDSMDKYNNVNKNEIKTILENIKQSKSKFYYYLNLISNNLEIGDTSLDFIIVCQKEFSDLIKYFDDLLGDINKANDLFNTTTENYKIHDIIKIIEDYDELNNSENIKEFVNINSYEKTLIEYKDDFNLLTEFSSLGNTNSSLVEKYFSDIWKDRLTSLNELNNTFNNHKEFTKLFNGGFFSQNVFTFLEKSDEEVKLKIQDLNSKCNEISHKTNNFDEQLIFYECNLEEVTFEEYSNKNNAALKTIDLLNEYNLTFSNYDKNKLIDFDKTTNFDSLDLIYQLYKDLNNLYNDSDVLKYNISFESQITYLSKVTENKNRFINLLRLRNSIENQNDIINNHFYKLWDGPNTEVQIILNKVSFDKEFTKAYNEGIFSDKTIELITKGEQSLDNYKEEFITKFNEIKNQIDKVSSSPVISNEFENEIQNTEFDIISKKTSEIQKGLNNIDSNYNDIKISKTFNLDEITTDINILDKIIQSKYIIYLNENLDNLNKSNENLKTSLSKHDELQSLKKIFDDMSVDHKYFKDIYTGYETSVSELNQQLDYNKLYEDLFEGEFFSNKTNKAIGDESKYNELTDLLSKMETHIINSINSFETLDLIHTEKEINLNKSLDDALDYVSFFDENIDQLKDWIEFEKSSKNLDNDSCHEFITAMYDDDIEPELINQTFTYNFARNLLNEIKQEYDFISQKDIDKYINLDKEVIELNRIRVLNEYVNSKPNFENMNSQDSTLMKQYKAYSQFDDLSLKNNGIIKDLLDASIDYIKAIKPIFITTPSSVFKYLSSCDFDYIIVDDINQSSPDMVITTLFRADKKIVIGDSKQSSIGLISVINDKFKTKSLKWNYNAKNTSFYDDTIISYPKQDGESTFEIINVDGAVYNISTQINEAEAEKIVDLAISHVNEYGFDKTLGIIAFTQAQKDYIIELLLKKLEKLPDLIQYFNPLDTFYVKYIDEVYESRDMVLASLTYGFDKDGILNIDFESENEYIFNKLMTKAFEKTIILVNFQLEDIVEDNNVKSLFEYKSISSKDFSLSLFEERIYNFLNDNKFNVKKQFIDFTIDDETSIECEGENFNKFKDVRDKFRLHKELLESQGWKSVHVCTGDWIDNRLGYQNKLLDLINSEIEFEDDEDISFEDDFEFDFENDNEITINELKELL